MVMQHSVEQIKLNEDFLSPKNELENLAKWRIDSHLDYQEEDVNNVIARHTEKHELWADSSEQMYSSAA